MQNIFLLLAGAGGALWSARAWTGVYTGWKRLAFGRFVFMAGPFSVGLVAVVLSQILSSHLLGSVGLGLFTLAFVLAFLSPELIGPQTVSRLRPSGRYGSPRRTVENDQATKLSSPYVLAGFDSARNYADRRPVWNPGSSFSNVTSAESAARKWLLSQGEEAQVEVIHAAGNEGTVVAVVSRKGTEHIG